MFSSIHWQIFRYKERFFHGSFYRESYPSLYIFFVLRLLDDIMLASIQLSDLCTSREIFLNFPLFFFWYFILQLFFYRALLTHLMNFTVISPFPLLSLYLRQIVLYILIFIPIFFLPIFAFCSLIITDWFLYSWKYIVGDG